MRKIILGLLLALCLVGCQINTGSGEGKNEENTIDFQRVNYEDLHEDLQAKIDELKYVQGYELFEDESRDDSYLVVFSGEKPTAGYSIEIVQVIERNGKTEVIVQETEPANDAMVAEVLTYPMDIVRLTGITNDITLQYLETIKPDVETYLIEADYVGQIDSNSIEVKFEDTYQALRLTESSSAQLAYLKVEEGDLVKLELFLDENNQQTIYSIEKVQ